MRILRGLGGAVLWLLAAVVGLVAVIMCVTVILLPLGIPLLGLARRMVTNGARTDVCPGPGSATVAVKKARAE